MTGKEIIKALEICIMGDCEICSCRCGSVGDCRDALNKKSLDLINRLQEENENLSHNNNELTKSILGLHKALKQAKAEAYKEFAERYKALLETELAWCECADEITKPIDNLLKEKVGGK